MEKDANSDRGNNHIKEFNSGKVKALNEFTLSIEKGEIFGIISPNRAGKTTFMSCLRGLLFPTSGSLLIDELSNFEFLEAAVRISSDEMSTH